MIAAVITRTGEILYAKLNQVVEQEPVDTEPKGTALGSAYASTGAAEPTPSPGVPVVGLSADRTGWIERLDDSYIGFTDPFAHIVAIDPDAVTVADWYKDAHISRVELPWCDMGVPGQFKEFFEVLLNFDRSTRAYVGLYVESDNGNRYSKWKGLAFGSDKPMRIPVTLQGTRIRIRLCMVTFNTGRLLLRDVRIGFNPAGTN